MISEAAVQQQIRLEAARRNTPLLRNNNGAAVDSTGRHIRFGLGNDSAKLNKTFKSSDLIGIHPVTITPEMVGQTIGVFFAVEVKAPGWKFRESDERAVAQRNFGDWVARHGGIFRFATDPSEVWG
jgi:hypothetical protein